jgi:cell division septum initiation protein DivIVA
MSDLACEYCGKDATRGICEECNSETNQYCAELRRDIRCLRDALAFYANAENWEWNAEEYYSFNGASNQSRIEADRGKKATQALSETTDKVPGKS